MARQPSGIDDQKLKLSRTQDESIDEDKGDNHSAEVEQEGGDHEEKEKQGGEPSGHAEAGAITDIAEGGSKCYPNYIPPDRTNTNPTFFRQSWWYQPVAR